MDEEELFELLYGREESSPVRRDLKLHVTMDDEGNPTIEIVGGEAFGLSQPGNSLDKVEISRDRIYSGCRCSTTVEFGGQCSLCNRAVCAVCWSRCVLCLCALCPGCLIRIPTESGKKDLCPKCNDEVRWKSLLNKTTLGLVSPVRF